MFFGMEIIVEIFFVLFNIEIIVISIVMLIEVN